MKNYTNELNKSPVNNENININESIIYDIKQLLKKYRERNREKKEEKEYNEKIISYR